MTGSAEGLGIQSLAKDMGYEVSVTMWTDSDTGRSLASRRGHGKMRHMELRYLWVQEVVKDGRMKVRRVSGEENPADHLTKPKTWAYMLPVIQKAAGDMLGASCYSDRGAFGAKALAVRGCGPKLT